MASIPKVLEKKYFLGFMSYSSHDPSAAMIELTNEKGNNSIRFIHFEEGMLSRKKKSYHFSTRSVAACLDYFDIQLSDVDKVVTDYMDNQSFIDTSYNYRHLVGDFIRSNLNLKPSQITPPVDHHYAHAMSAWVGSGYEDCAILAIDGLGSSQSTHTVFTTENKKLNKIFTQTTPGIGSLYSLITELIGFKPGEEGKTMGLAPYGKNLFSGNEFPAIDFKGTYESLSVDYSNIINRSPNKYLLSDFDFYKFEQRDLYNDIRAYMAYCIQQELERCLIHIVKEIKKICGKSRLCLVGGVALNCVANELIVDTGIFESVYVFPDSADSGLSVGLVFTALNEHLNEFEWNNFLAEYNHPKFAPSEAVPINVESSLEKLPWGKLDEDVILQELEKNSVVGIFTEGYEYGPRALGHRSFLAKAASPKMKEILNQKIKHREAYRPFAPICLPDDFDIFFESAHRNHEYMSYAVKVKQKAKDLVPSVVHFDDTARVQIATQDCGLVYRILISMKQRNGYGILINTSLNDNDEPIVFDELDAISCFLRTNCDVLVVNNKMLLRENLKYNLDELSYEIQLASIKKNNERFSKSLKKIMKAETTNLENFLQEYNLISTFYKSYRTAIRFHNLIIGVKSGKKARLSRIVVSSREIKTIEELLEKYFCSWSEITDKIIEVDDSSKSIYSLKDGDLVISYNLSNTLRDYNFLGLLHNINVENFYKSSDFPITNLSKDRINYNKTIEKLSETYENNNLLGIESIF
jgi:carbamoyltransferase